MQSCSSHILSLCLWIMHNMPSSHQVTKPFPLRLRAQLRWADNIGCKDASYIAKCSLLLETYKRTQSPRSSEEMSKSCLKYNLNKCNINIEISEIMVKDKISLHAYYLFTKTQHVIVYLKLNKGISREKDLLFHLSDSLRAVTNTCTIFQHKFQAQIWLISQRRVHNKCWVTVIIATDGEPRN